MDYHFFEKEKEDSDMFDLFYVNMKALTIDISDFLRQEISFFDANLYFKHNVNKKQEYHDNPPIIRDLSKYFLLSLSWLLQIIIETIEDEQIKDFKLNTDYSDSTILITITTQNGHLPDTLVTLLNSEPLFSGCSPSRPGASWRRRRRRRGPPTPGPMPVPGRPAGRGAGT